uniref:Uncharacterized protein n=1 Tax=Anguilla anguilla TaxID=7936 RepID=A0A0E9UT69_ANGAN
MFRLLEQRRKPHSHSIITGKELGVSVRRHWESTEWRSWYVFDSFCCLQGLLREKNMKHLGLIISAVFLISQDVKVETDGVHM